MDTADRACRIHGAKLASSGGVSIQPIDEARFYYACVGLTARYLMWAKNNQEEEKPDLHMHVEPRAISLSSIASYEEVQACFRSTTGSRPLDC
jgi:hypothetical protein